MLLSVALKDILSQEKDLVFYENVDLTGYSTLGLTSFGHLVVVKNLNGLKMVVKLFFQYSIDYMVIGLGANLVLKRNMDKILIKLDFDFDSSYLDEIKCNYILPASVRLSRLTASAIKNELSGWEIFTGIPATLGGAVAMNAGTNLGEISSLVKRVSVISKTGICFEIELDPSFFSYRSNKFLSNGDIIYEVVISHGGMKSGVAGQIKQYLQKRKETQPLDKKTCGCLFKNKIGLKTCLAGQYLDILGMKGFICDGLGINRVHANFAENHGHADDSSFNRLVQLVSEELYLQFGIHFDVEIRF